MDLPPIPGLSRPIWDCKCNGEIIAHARDDSKRRHDSNDSDGSNERYDSNDNGKGHTARFYAAISSLTLVRRRVMA